MENRTPISVEELWGWYPQIKATAIIVSQHHEPEDLCIDVLLRMHDKLDRINHRAQIHNIVRNMNINRHRKWGRMVPTDPDKLNRDAVAIDDHFVKVHYREVMRAILTLPAWQRNVLKCTRDGYSQEETGKMLGIPTSTVKTRLWRARKALRALLQE